MHLVARETLPEPNSHGEIFSFCFTPPLVCWFHPPVPPPPAMGGVSIARNNWRHFAACSDICWLNLFLLPFFSQIFPLCRPLPGRSKEPGENHWEQLLSPPVSGAEGALSYLVSPLPLTSLPLPVFLSAMVDRGWSQEVALRNVSDSSSDTFNFPSPLFFSSSVPICPPKTLPNSNWNIYCFKLLLFSFLKKYDTENANLKLGHLYI